ncbi:hypothetical protein BC936DRAFT_136724 [Jimgerdemannia flammicorona]|uniref:ATP-dependent DNA helicase n=1 Tax=Jimgerdemannia flammicorona TaxID=994334 RepID=A0A433CYX2_9FUNG|nr:hypothetical protein BC936DRAFT_136724 [Jimgerdemannia flammicorona]
MSMLNCDLLMNLDAIVRWICCRNDVFSGIQVIFCGDFLQLAPVEYQQHQQQPSLPRYAFESPIWNMKQIVTVELKMPYRQQTDTGFAELLNQIYIGQFMPDVLRQLQIRCNLWPLSTGCTSLCATYKEVKAINDA